MRHVKEASGRNRRALVIAIGLVTLTLSKPAASQRVFILTLDGFEKSNFLKTHKPIRKSNWALKTGGTNYSYAFADPEGTDQNVSVDLSSEPLLLTRLGVSFHGTSVANAARFTERRERFLRDLLSSTHPDVHIDRLIALVKSEQARNYDGGSDQMPRVSLGSASAFVGTVGSSLIVGLQS